MPPVSPPQSVSAHYQSAIHTAGADAFFQLANEREVRFTVRPTLDIIAVQDVSGTSTSHCGSIVWESAFCLAERMRRELLPALASRRRRAAKTKTKTQTHTGSPPTTTTLLELGAGCALCGLVAVAMGVTRAVLTDHPDALTVTRTNVEANMGALVAAAKAANAALPPPEVRVLPLDWTDDTHIAPVLAEAQNGYDFIIGTDVVFAERLVDPLLDVIARCLKPPDADADADADADGRKGDEEDGDDFDCDARGGGVCWICVQQRCAIAHEAFVQRAKTRFECTVTSGAALGFVDEHCWLLTLRAKRRNKKPNDDTTTATSSRSGDDDGGGDDGAIPPSPTRTRVHKKAKQGASSCLR